MSDLCGEWTGCSEDIHTGEIRAGRIWCRSWKCEHCAPKRRAQLQAQAAAGRPCTLITLTIPYGSHDSADEAARTIVHAWRMTIQRGKREKRFGKLQYIAVFEETKKGWPHLHILARAPYIEQAWLSKTLKHFGAGAIVDIRRVYNARHAARYVGKYVSKAPHRYEGCKRYWRTHGYDLDPREKVRVDPARRVGWLSRSDVASFAWVLEQNRYELEWTGNNSFTAMPTAWRIYRKHDPPPDHQAIQSRRIKPI